uniref:(northern house mosquito) hypothetical protein n=1 Tax=Culex pipiens TaxID=7175 RepID=A0A8D8G2K0_CULPI
MAPPAGKPSASPSPASPNSLASYTVTCNHLVMLLLRTHVSAVITDFTPNRCGLRIRFWLVLLQPGGNYSEMIQFIACYSASAAEPANCSVLLYRLQLLLHGLRGIRDLSNVLER